MKVQEARIIGFLMGLTSGVISFAYNSLISLGIGGMGMISFFLWKKVIKGPNGACLEGIGMGLFFVSFSQTITSVL